ncbi:hypothetical protein [Streptomyces sp. NPDC058667]|uniref:hypothetical protein n=1 Tax=Streptomyces sp. NPDC058667 TaxID=3346588 RepID=UPI0036661D87
MSASDSQDRAWQRHRIAEQIDADVRRWRADRRMREARESTALCQAIWQLPAHEPARKETGK